MPKSKKRKNVNLNSRMKLFIGTRHVSQAKNCEPVNSTLSPTGVVLNKNGAPTLFYK